MHSSTYRLILMLSALAVVGVFATSCAQPAQQPTTPETTETPTAAAVSYTTDLVAPAGVTTTATGSSNVDIEGDSASFGVTVQELSDINMAHIHVSEAPGGSGPPAVWLYPDTQEPALKAGVTNGELASGTFDATTFVGPLEGKTMADLVTAINEGRAYVNVHTAAYPDGEISGFLAQ